MLPNEVEPTVSEEEIKQMALEYYPIRIEHFDNHFDHNGNSQIDVNGSMRIAFTEHIKYAIEKLLSMKQTNK
jgi:hypothetical protein